MSFFLFNRAEPASRGPRLPCTGLNMPMMSYVGTQIVNFAAVPDPTEPSNENAAPAPSAPPISEAQENKEKGMETSVAAPRKEEVAVSKETSPPAAQSEKHSFDRDRIGIPSEFYRMNANEKFSTLKDYVDCLIYQMKSFGDIMPPDQLATRVNSNDTLQF